MNDITTHVVKTSLSLKTKIVLTVAAVTVGGLATYGAAQLAKNFGGDLKSRLANLRKKKESPEATVVAVD